MKGAMRIHTLIVAGSLGLMMSMGGLAGCAHSDRTAGGRIDDMMTARKVKSALKDSTVYKFNDVKVSAYNGVVQLSGWVSADPQKAKATEIAQRVQGVREVVNNISLKPQYNVGASSSSNPSQTGSSGSQENRSSSYQRSQSSDQSSSSEADRLEQERTREQQLRDQQR